MSEIGTKEAIAWLRECARYFTNEASRSKEDMGHWAGVANAETANRIADMLSGGGTKLAPQSQEGTQHE